MRWHTCYIGELNDMDSVLLEQQTKTLPPLILHPFADSTGPGKLVESSRASLMLQGLLPSGDLTSEQLEQRLLDGRYCEIRMLFYVGKDLIRWAHQCVDDAARQSQPGDPTYTFQSFVSLLIARTPASVQAKLRKWGVADYRSIFSRAIALNMVFAGIPDRQTLSDEFVRNYFKFADHIYRMLMQSAFAEVDDSFEFELYASGEYSRMLERQWGAGATED
jgi:hypothetical protein